MKIVVTGANGQLGNCIEDINKSRPDWQFYFYTRAALDITNEAAVAEMLKRTKPDCMINTAAYTAVDKAENEAEKAFAANAEAPGILAALCKTAGTKFIHVSTDYVFDGTADKPYVENDAVNPQGVYGKSKLAGEQNALQANADSIIVRTSWVYSTHGNNFVKTMLRLMGERPSLNVVNDQTGSPTYAPDLAEALLQLASLPVVPGGIYHYSNSGAITWYDFAVAIRDMAGFTTEINAIPTAQFPTPAKRPAWSVLDCGKIAALKGIEIKPWQPSLVQCISLLQAQ